MAKKMYLEGIYIFKVFAFSQVGLPLKKRICSPWGSKFFSFRVAPHQNWSIFMGSKFISAGVISLCKGRQQISAEKSIFLRLPFSLKYVNIRKRGDPDQHVHLHTAESPTGDQEVAGSIPAEVSNILSWRLIVKYFLRSFSPFRWFKKGSCQFLDKECSQYWLTA